MEHERWRQVERLYHAALEVDVPGRGLFLQVACRGDEALRCEVESLLQYQSRAEKFIEEPAVKAAARLLVPELTTGLVGRTLGHYSLLSHLASGGMGDVYRAYDERLEREVAVKVLPPYLASNPLSLARFGQEARAVAALSHPNILAIHDFASEGEVHYAITELLDGQTLRARLAAGPVAWPEAVRIGIAIADGLTAAHAKGILHRDLKPENIFLTVDRRVKILDFGLAQTPAAAVAIESVGVMGTAAYMAPEQAGGSAGMPSDIFSLGAVLYELLTGERAFLGQTTIQVMAAAARIEPRPIREVVPTVPRELEAIVQRCLRKDPARRFQAANDLSRALADIQLNGRQTRAAAAWTRSALLLALAIPLLNMLYRAVEQPPTLKPIPFTALPGSEAGPSFSSDGSSVAFAWDGGDRSTRSIYVKRIGATEPEKLTWGDADDHAAAWSPDGAKIAFLRGRSAGRVELLLKSPLGGPERKLGEFASRSFPAIGPELGWSPDSKWLAASLDLMAKDAEQTAHEFFPLLLISAETGEAREITTPPQLSAGDSSPAFAPDGRTLAFVRWAKRNSGDIYLQALGPNYSRHGEPVRLTSNGEWTMSLVWTGDGRELVYASGPPGGESTLWRIRTQPRAQRHPLPFFSLGARGLTLSRNRVVWTQQNLDVNIWRRSIAPGHEGSRPVLFAPSTRLDFSPEYSPDGSKVAFLSDRDGAMELWVANADGSSQKSLCKYSGMIMGCLRWSHDGRQIAFASQEKGANDIYIIGLDGGSPRQLTDDPAQDMMPEFSRDGRTLYFTSSRGGSFGIWKMPVSGGVAIRMTGDGGMGPRESPDGKFIYYGIGSPGKSGSIFRIPAAGGPAVKVLEDTAVSSNYTVTSEGIWYLQKAPSQQLPVLKRFNPETGQTRTWPALTGAPFEYGVSVSPDGRSVLYSQIDRLDSDLMLVENFR
jgi:serine/threonine protein kinase/WD40 repeat protein